MTITSHAQIIVIGLRYKYMTKVSCCCILDPLSSPMAPSRPPNAKRPKCKGKEVSRPHSLPHRGPAQPPREVHVLETLSFLQRLLWDRKPTLSTRVQNMPPIDPDLLDLARRSPFLNDRLRTTGYRVINVIVASIIAEGPCGPNRRQV